MMRRLVMDYIVQKIVALGIPGIVLLVAMAASGWAGAAAITTALATLGGPFGMIGGIAMLGVLVIVSDGIAKYGFEKLLKASINEMEKRGTSSTDIIRKVQSYPISPSLKKRVLDELSSFQ
jgi:uncharacterized membrane protein